MKFSKMPFVSAVLESGADDHVYDGLLLIGPVVILLIAVLEPILALSGVAQALAIAYVTAFVVYVLYRGVRAN
ncbi:hypothetical protein HLRTI_001861 [Halorhabdus tiamatea SARL4B]|uniref:Uncharacterized protein n=1 Tax=Halorhabdus tiamatea SARL4B TaxID=1033806 RepID=F7PQE1_9EURY|nr:hypothetical protein [Halorhabdus tiamatea]ERJ06098.1 hypothetical protein HLRTI_001861 [Halorhabdus tiamatea SARL4B]CCQ33272.1 hypothetical protein HTIA_1134 [Halorhabdus tiamatea SARL4B]